MRSFAAPWLASLICAVAALGLPGCQSTRYGSALTMIRLNSNPEEADAYLVDIEKWNALGRQHVLESTDWEKTLAPFKVAESLTPVTTKRNPYRFIFIASRSGFVPSWTEIKVMSSSERLQNGDHGPQAFELYLRAR